MGKLGIPIGFVEPYAVLGVGGYYVKATAWKPGTNHHAAGVFRRRGGELSLGETVFLGVEARYLVLSATARLPHPLLRFDHNQCEP